MKGSGRAVLRLRVAPNAHRNEVVGNYGGSIKLKIAAPAADGKANAELLDFLADRLGVSAEMLELVGGEQSREKMVAVTGMDEAAARKRLLHGPEAPEATESPE